MPTSTKTYVRPSIDKDWWYDVADRRFIQQYINEKYIITGKILRFDSIQYETNPLITDIVIEWKDMDVVDEFSSDPILLEYWSISRDEYNNENGVTTTPAVWT